MFIPDTPSNFKKIGSRSGLENIGQRVCCKMYEMAGLTRNGLFMRMDNAVHVPWTGHDVIRTMWFIVSVLC